MALALQLAPTTGRADLPIYTDGDLYGWTDPATMVTKSWQEGSWGIADDFYNTSPVHSGQSSIALHYDCGWCALSLYTNPPLDRTGIKSLRFWLNGGEQGGQQDLLVRVCDNANEPICLTQPLAPVANQWTQVELPLDGFAGANIASIQWNNWSGDPKSPVYLDDIVLVGAQGSDGTVPLFTDVKSPNWNFWNTNTENRVVATPTHSGNGALAVDSLQGWNTMQLGHISSAENITGLYTLRFWINGGDTGGQRITVSAMNNEGNGTLDTLVTAEANTWKKVEIPLDELGDPLTVYSIRWWNGSPDVMPTFYLDDIALVPGPGPADQGPVDISVVYGDFLPRGWIDMFANASGDDSTAANLTSATTVHGGATAIEVNNLQAGKLVALGHPKGGLEIPGYDTLRLFIHGATEGGQQVTVEVMNEDYASTEPLEVTAQAGTWTQVDIPLGSQLNPLNVFIIRIWNKTSETLPTFYLDDIRFVNASGAPPPPTTVAGPNLSVDTASDRHPISPYIYGMNAPEEALAQDLRLPVNRWGGNQTSTYNWQNDTYNTGFDWFYENISNSTPASLPNGSSANRFVEQNRRTGTASLMTLPMIGWVAKRWKGSHPFDCAFKQSLYGPQQKADWEYDPDCGNGLLTDGTQIDNDPNDFAIPIGPAFVQDWITYLTGRYGTAAAGGVSFYALDNEPMLWNSTHNEVRKTPLSTDELIDLTYAYAPAIKAVDPSAKLFGPVFWGWCAYFYSAVDNCTNNGTADYQAHGGIPLVAWYLQKMRAYEQQHGVRILDYLDLHGYPNSAGVYSTALGNRSTQALRLRSTRSLWDPSYQDESWVPAAIQLIPRMRAWVAENYPGTKLAITEYNWGALGYMNGALAQADILGIFGREGLDLATLWDSPKTAQPGAMAFRMYLNYDGQGATFGDTGVHAQSADQEKLAIYAAQLGTKLTLMIVNKTALALTSPVALAGFQPAATAQVYRYSAAHLAGIVREADQAMSDTGFTGVFPPASITLVVADQAAATATSTLAIAKSGTGQGRVASNPNGIDCGDLCNVGFPRGGSVTLTASPSPGSVFAGWGGACTGTGTCAVTMDAPQSVTATFTLNNYTLTINQTGTGSGTVGGGGSYAYNTQVTPTAAAATGSTFTGWSPTSCAGTFALTADTTCTATFSLTRGLTSTTVASSLNPATIGKPVKFTARVTPAAATGTVTFMDGTTTLGTGTRVGGIATYNATGLAIGSHSITAVLSATGVYTGSTSAPLTQSIKGNTVTTVATDLTPAILGQTVTFTATVTPSAATGAVTFKEGATVLGTGTLSGGTATFSTAALTVGNHRITAVVAGDSLYNPSTSTALVQTVKVPTATTLGSSLSPSTYGQAVTFTARVTPGTATGTVTFKDGAVILGTRTLAGGTATVSSKVLTIGSHSITAVLTGTGVYAGSTSGVISQTVNPVPTSTTVASSLNPATVGKPVRFTARVTPAAATGTVTFMDGTTTLGTGTRVGGIATYNTRGLAIGSHSITAVLTATGVYTGSTSAVVVQQVN